MEDHLLLEDMLEAARKIKRNCAGYNYEDFLNDEKTMHAVVGNFEVIGEASNNMNCLS